MLSVLHYQTPKGVLVLDSSGVLYLSIPSNATCHSYDHGQERPVVNNDSTSRKQSFPYKGASGMLSYKQGSTLQSIVVTATDRPEIKSEKTLRFALEANSVVTPSMTPGKYTNIMEISLNLTAMTNGQYNNASNQPLHSAMLPPANMLSRDPVQLLQQLTSGGSMPPRSNQVSKGKPGCCDVQMSTYDPVQGGSQNVQLSQSSRNNPELEKRIREATERMLKAPSRTPQAGNFSQLRPASTQSVETIMSGADGILANYTTPPQVQQQQVPQSQQQGSQQQQQQFQQFQQFQQMQQAQAQPQPPASNSTLNQTLQSLQALTQQIPSTPGLANPMAALQQALAGAPQSSSQSSQQPTQQVRPPPQNFAERFNTAQKLASTPSHSQPLGRPQAQQQAQQMYQSQSQPRQVPQQPLQQSTPAQSNPAATMMGNAMLAGLAGLASMPGMANAMNVAMAQGNAPSTDELMKLADDIIRKGKAKGV